MIQLLVKSKYYQILIVLLTLMFFTNGLAISYTVQVIALSSEANVRLLEERLKEMGFPAYTITVPTNQGQIFRLRVGSFADREAAQKYAQAMQGVLDSSPVPQLAEGIPTNLVPVEAGVLVSYPIKDTIIRISSKQDRIMIRIQTLGEFNEASYIIEDFNFNAYRATLSNDNKILRVFSKRLWPEVYPLDSNIERDMFHQNTIIELAAKLNISNEEIRKHQFLNKKSEPFLVLVEQIDLQNGNVSLLKALGRPGSKTNEFGPELDWFASEPIDIIESKAEFEITSQTRLSTKQLSTDTWILTAKNNFAELELIESKQKWLLVAGKPIWAKANLLLTSYNNMFELYQLK